MINNRFEKNRKIEFFLNKVYHLLFSEKFSKKKLTIILTIKAD